MPLADLEQSRVLVSGMKTSRVPWSNVQKSRVPVSDMFEFACAIVRDWEVACFVVRHDTPAAHSVTEPNFFFMGKRCLFFAKGSFALP